MLFNRSDFTYNFITQTVAQFLRKYRKQYEKNAKPPHIFQQRTHRLARVISVQYEHRQQAAVIRKDQSLNLITICYQNLFKQALTSHQERV